MGKGYNLQNVNELSGGDNEFVGVLVQTFLEEIPPDLDLMVEAIQSNNPDMAYQYAHKMKPNLQLFGIQLMNHIKEVETWSQTNKGKEAIQPTLDHIVATIKVAVLDLKKDFN